MYNKLVFEREKNTTPYPIRPNTKNTYDFWWGKGCTIKDEVHFMGILGSCKDYLVDLQYRPANSTASRWRKDAWTPEQQKEVCYIINMPLEWEERFRKNITDVIHAYEKAHRIKRTIVTKLTYDDNTYFCIKGSDMWGKTCLALSHYLTLIRMAALSDNLRMDNLGALQASISGSTNDGYALANLASCQKRVKVFNHFLNNPRLLMKFNPKYPNDVSGIHPKSRDFHGITGLMTQLHYMSMPTPLKNDYVYSIYEELTKDM